MEACTDCGGNVIVHGDCIVCTNFGPVQHSLLSAALWRQLEATLASVEPTAVSATLAGQPERELEAVA